MKNKNFKIVTFTNETNILEQIYTIYNAQEIISPIGASCNNILFKNKKCVFKCLIPSFNPYRGWGNIYNIFENYKLIECGQLTDTPTLPDRCNSEWRINDDFEQMIFPVNHCIFIPIGMQCSTPHVLKNFNLRNISYPFDWILSNPSFVYKMLYLLLEQNISVEKIVNEHFFRNDEKVGFDIVEHYTSRENGKAIYNKLYDVIFPHDEYNETSINKYIRRFTRLKTDLLNPLHHIRLVYVSQASTNIGNFTINGKEVIRNVYKNISNIHNLVMKFNKNSKIILFDSIQNEDINLLDPKIDIYMIPEKKNRTELIKEVEDLLSKTYIH